MGRRSSWLIGRPACLAANSAARMAPCCRCTGHYSSPEQWPPHEPKTAPLHADSCRKHRKRLTGSVETPTTYGLRSAPLTWPSTPRVAAGALFADDDRVLLVR